MHRRVVPVDRTRAVHRFGPPRDWDGWILIVAPHHGPDEIERLPPHIGATEAVVIAIVELFNV